MLTENDLRTRHCPMLGHELAFSYCRQPGSTIPCRKILDCWWETFDVKAFLEAHYDTETLEQISAPPKPKMLSIMEMIEQARKRAGQ